MITRKEDMQIKVLEQMRGGNGSAKLTGLISEFPKHARLFSTITLEPGSSIGYHVHENETELFYFVSGEARVRDDENTYELSAGDSMSTGHGHGHGVESIGDEPLVMVACIVLD